MLTPEELRNIPEEVVSIIELCEDDILKDIGRRIAETGKLTPTAINQLMIRKNATLLRKDVTKTLAKYSGLTEKAIQSLLANAGIKSIEHEDEMLPKEKRGRKSKKLENIIRSNITAVNGTMANMTKGTAREVSKRYTDAINRSLVNVKSGAFSYEHEIRRACDSLADSMTYVKRSDGKYETLEVAVRRAVRTGLSVMAGQLAMQYCEDIGAEYVEVSAHEGARTGSKLHDPSNHAWWQGKVFHIGGDRWHKKKKYLDFMTNTGYGTGEGLCGWNCRHSFHAFFPDSMEPAYDYKTLRKLNAKNISYNGKKYSKYEIDQMQRYLERQVRKYKRRYELEASSELDAARSRAKLREWQEELRNFTNATGNKREYAREYVAIGKAELREAAAIHSREELMKDVKMAFEAISANKVQSKDDLSQFFKERYILGENPITGGSVYIRNRSLTHLLYKHSGDLSLIELQKMHTILEFPFSRGMNSAGRIQYYFVKKADQRDGYYDAILEVVNDKEYFFHFNYKGKRQSKTNLKRFMKESNQIYNTELVTLLFGN